MPVQQEWELSFYSFFAKAERKKYIVLPSRTFSKMERNYFFREKDIRHYLMDNYISQVLVMGGGKHIDHELNKDMGPKGQCCSSDSSQDTERGFDLSCVSI